MNTETLDESKLKIIDNELLIKPKPAPLIPRALMFIFAFISMLFPLIGVLLSIISGNGFHFGFIFGIALFGVIGFYMLRVALWNTYGEEYFKFNPDSIDYEANYGWFKDGKKSLDVEDLNFSIQAVGYEDENKGVLVIAQNEKQIKCASKRDIQELEELISALKKRYLSTNKTD